MSNTPQAPTLSPQELQERLKRIKDKIRVTKVVCTRSVKGQNGDNFAGFSANWDSVQDDGSQGLEDLSDGTDTVMSLKEAVVASHIVAMQADITAYEHAMASGAISVDNAERAINVTKSNYSRLIRQALE